MGFDETRWAMNGAFLGDENLTGYLAKLAEIRMKFPTLSQTPWQVQQMNDRKGVLVFEKEASMDALLHFLINLQKV